MAVDLFMLDNLRLVEERGREGGRGRMDGGSCHGGVCGRS